jgi:hypothetical protein
LGDVRVKRRARVFVLILAIADVVSFGLTQQYAGVDRGFEAVSLVTAFLTAGYAVLEEASTKQLPLLRISPKVTAGWGLGSIGFAVDVANIGDSIAHDTRIVCKLTGTPALQMNSSGVFKVEPMAPRERTTVVIVDSVETGSLQTQQFELTADYKDSEGEKMKQVKLSGAIKPLLDEMTRELLRRG